MLFKKLRLKNIRSYENLELEFPKGSTLLSGDIGVGKTSILLALQFALFGLQPGQKGASILRQGESEAYVFLEMDIEGNNVCLERTLKKGKSISQDSNIIVINGERKELSTSEMKNKVIEMLNYPKEFVKKSNLLYKFTVYTPQEEMKAIIQERSEIRLDTLRHIFGIDRYKTIKENSQILLQRVKEAIRLKEVETREINPLKERLILENENKVQLAKKINNLNIGYNNLLGEKIVSENRLKEVEGLIEKKRALDYELSKKRIELSGKNEMKTRIAKEMGVMQKQIEEKIDFSEDKLKEVSQLLVKHKGVLENLNSKFLEVNSEISVLNSRKENSLQLKEKVVSLENCPTCFQQVSQEHKDKISKRTQYDLEEIERDMNKKVFEKNQLIKDIDAEKELIRGYETDKNKLEAEKIKFQHQKNIETKIKSDSFVLDRLLQEIEQIKMRINEIGSSIKQFEETEKKFQSAKIWFDEINDKLKNVEISLAEKKKEDELVKIRLNELQKDISKKEKIRDQINYLRGFQDWMEAKFSPMISLIEVNVLAKLRSEFSRIFNEWFSMLVSDSLLVRLDEDFTPIISQKDYELDYEFLSGGERTAVALAYRLALNQVLNSLLSKINTKDIVILDEPTDGFSEQQLDKMRDILSQLTAEQIILVSHEQKIEGFVDNIIKIKKEGVSGIESV